MRRLAATTLVAFDSRIAPYEPGGLGGGIGANVYAVPGGVASGGGAEFFGSIYASELSTDGQLAVHYDRNVLEAGRECDPPDDGDGGGDTDAGLDAGDGGSSGSDALDSGTDALDSDAGSGDQVCGDRGDGCADDGECCSPLVCHEQTCELLECRPLGESCSTADECCSGTCASSVCVSG